MQETSEMLFRSLGQADALKEEMATHSTTLTWRIPWTEEPGGYSPRGCKESDTTKATQHTCDTCTICEASEHYLKVDLDQLYMYIANSRATMKISFKKQQKNGYAKRKNGIL